MPTTEETINSLYPRTGKMLARMRKSKLELTQTEMAQRFDSNSQYVSNWERGQCLPPPRVMKKLLKVVTDHEKAMLKGFLKADLIESYWTQYE